jgi:hydroxyacyl-ACP dehydratase HTD2-like protein with hotdog domain
MTTSTKTEAKQDVFAQDLEVGSVLPAHVHTPTEVQLFRYCAVSWNSHRIHYDRGWAQHEGYPNVLVQSHLHGAFFTSLVFDWAGSTGRVDRLQYSVRRFACPGDELTFEGTITALEEVEGGVSASVDLKEIRYADDTTCAIGDANVFFPHRKPAEG